METPSATDGDCFWYDLAKVLAVLGGMKEVNTIDVLNRLLAVHTRSFSRYLQSAPPFVGDRGASEEPLRAAWETFEAIADDHEQMAERISAMILAADATPDTGEFPMEFTDLHDLTMAYIVRRAIAYQRQDIATIGDCDEALRLAPAAQALAEEALGMAVGHLESLEELACSKAST